MRQGGGISLNSFVLLWERQKAKQRCSVLFYKIHWNLQNHKKVILLFVLEMKLVWGKVWAVWLACSMLNVTLMCLGISLHLPSQNNPKLKLEKERRVNLTFLFFKSERWFLTTTGFSHRCTKPQILLRWTKSSQICSSQNMDLVSIYFKQVNIFS